MVDPAGLMLTLRLDRVSPERVEGVVVAERPHNPEPQAAKIVIAIAHLPAPALELVLSRCTEAGAFAFHIVQADRSVARGSKPERWRTICREAAMLAGRLVIPEVTGPVVPRRGARAEHLPCDARPHRVRCGSPNWPSRKTSPSSSAPKAAGRSVSWRESS